MPTLTATDFRLANASPESIAKLNLALAYGEQQDVRLGAMLKMVADNHTTIMFNTSDNMLVQSEIRGQTLYSATSNMILWNPDEGALVWMNNANGQVVISGVQSPADGLFHESYHSLDPIQKQNSQIPDSQYENLSERVAVTIESVVNAWIGEPSRNNHDGVSVWVNDPTVHTITTEDGALQLVRMAADGTPEYGPQIAYNGPEWRELEDAFINGGIGNHQNSGGSGDNDDPDHQGDTDISGNQHGSGYDGQDGDDAGHGPGEDWVPWNGDIGGGGGGNTNPPLEQTSGDDPDYYQHPFTARLPGDEALQMAYDDAGDVAALVGVPPVIDHITLM